MQMYKRLGAHVSNRDNAERPFTLCKLINKGISDFIHLGKAFI